jgi:sec-independent protein translocase protein TatA
MRPPGPLEIILILVIVFIIFGAGKLPQIFEFVGKGFRTLRRSAKDEDDEEVKVAKKGRKKKAA